MKNYKVPLKKPKPDIKRFLDAMSGKKIPDKVPMVEYLIDNAMMKPILEKMMCRKWVDTSDKTEYMGGQMDFSKENLALIDAWLDRQQSCRADARGKNVDFTKRIVPASKTGNTTHRMELSLVELKYQ